MHILTKLYVFYFSLVFHHHVSESVVEFTFRALSLGHSGLLIIWEPNFTRQNYEKSDDYMFMFKKYVIEDKNDGSSRSDNNQNPSTVEGNEFSETTDGGCESKFGQYKIHSLSESTNYTIIIQQYNKTRRDNLFYGRMPDSQILRKYTVETRTGSKSKRIPAKPYFEVTTSNYLHRHLIRWYPCGRERICRDQESGTHFGITIKEPYNRRQLIEIKREKLDEDTYEFFFLPGRIYEVIIYSINDEHKTYSDSQEIFFKPTSSPVQYVNVISLPNLRVLISWKLPKQSLGTSIIGFLHLRLSEKNKDGDLLRNDPWYIETPLKQLRISNLKPEVTYTHYIFPVSQEGLGFEYQITYKHQELPITKQDD